MEDRVCLRVCVSVCFCLLLRLILGSVCVCLCVCAYRQVIVFFPFSVCMKLKGQFSSQKIIEKRIFSLSQRGHFHWGREDKPSHFFKSCFFPFTLNVSCWFSERGSFFAPAFASQAPLRLSYLIGEGYWTCSLKGFCKQYSGLIK